MSDPGRRLDTGGVLAALEAGEVVILPTDTLPGLHARLDRPGALAAIADLKGREPGKPLLVLVDGRDAALRLMAPVAAPLRAYLDLCWPGPFTMVAPATPGLPRAVVGDRGTVAVRVPAPEPLRNLLSRSGPLASTSVNRAGEDPATSTTAAGGVFPALPVWDVPRFGGGREASALLDVTGERPRVLRPGPSAPPPWPSGS